MLFVYYFNCQQTLGTYVYTGKKRKKALSVKCSLKCRLHKGQLVVWESTPDYRWIGKCAGLMALGIFWSRLFPVGYCYSWNFVEFSAQNLNNKYLGKNSWFWLREMSFSMINDISDKKKEKKTTLLFFHKKSYFSIEWIEKALK